MGILDKIFKREKKDNENIKINELMKEDSLKEPSLDNVKKLLEKIEAETKCEAIKIDILPFANVQITDSKFGGIPFMPKEASIPKDEEGNQLTFLAQINCQQLPENSIYPSKGILQFWILDDDVMGLNFDDGIDDNTKRVVYYSDIEDFYNEDEIKEIYRPFCEDDYSYFPLSKGSPFGLKFTKIEEGIQVSDFRFEKIFVDLWNENFKDYQIHNIFDNNIPDKIAEYIYDNYSGAGHKIGGYAYFTQTDPRCYDYKDYEVMLLQIDSDWSQEKGYEIMWGDSGVGSFFITKENLKALNFEGCLYNWDCC